jgi:hypothetical protein
VLPGRAAASTGFLDDDVDQALTGIHAGEQRTRRGRDQNVPAEDQDFPPAKHQDSREAVPVAREENSNGSGEEQSVAAGNGDQGQAADQEQDAVKEKSQPGAGGILPTKAAEDDPRRWGDADDDHDAWLKEQKPPHWG